jgi:hypothetical protein
LPARGNIKVKRSSVHQIDLPAQASPQEEESLGGNDHTLYGVHTPKKVSQFFPELALGTEAS